MKYIIILTALLLTACAQERKDFRFIVYDPDSKRPIYCETEEKCEEIKKLYAKNKKTNS